MKVKMTANYGIKADATPWFSKGETVEVDDELAVELLATGRAEAVAEKATDKAEKATAPKRESRTRNSK